MRDARTVRAMILTMTVLAGLLGPGLRPPARAQGVAELALDRAAVRSLLAAAVADPISVQVPGWGELTLLVSPPGAVEFIDGGVETEVEVRLQQLELPLSLHVRYEPVVEAQHGTVRLAAVAATPATPLPLAVDLAPLLPAAELPRRLHWQLQGPGGRPLPVQAMVQGVVIEEERLVVLLGLSMRAAAGMGGGPGR